MLHPIIGHTRVLLLAAALDALFGDPPTALHPIGWLGRGVRAVEARAPHAATSRAWYGARWAVAWPLIAAGAASLAVRGFTGAGGARLLAEALVLDITFALHALLARAEEVRRALDTGALDEARLLLSTHLVSRETADLSASEVAGATIESVAENLSDGVIGPWIAYAVLGVPGAAGYRAVNTLDSMWGYRSTEYIDLGRAAARLDDAVNWVPARATALAVVLGAVMTGEDAAGALRVWHRDGARTDSPNAGRPMAAMAGALGVALVKRDEYRIGDGRHPQAVDIGRAVRVARAGAAVVGGVLVAAMLGRRLRWAGVAS